MRAHNKLGLAIAAAALMTTAACSSGDVTAPELSAGEHVVLGGGLINVQVTDVLNDLTVDVDVTNNNVAVQVCAIVELLDTELGTADDYACDITQAQRGANPNPHLVGPIVIGGGLVNVQVTDVLNDLTVNIDVSNNNVAVQVCAAVEALSGDILALESLECTITQN